MALKYLYIPTKEIAGTIIPKKVTLKTGSTTELSEALKQGEMVIYNNTVYIAKKDSNFVADLISIGG